MLREVAPLITSKHRLESVCAVIAYGSRDSVRPIDWAKEADAWLERVGVEHEIHFYGMPQEIVAVELNDFSQWLTKTLQLNN
ncbi:MAG: phospholipase/carboxylesterase [Pseudomonas sp.]|nr:phospholipase/carboxylesterase [Pseudomonas sp.]